MRYVPETLSATEKIRVLVVDDSVVIRRMLSRILESDSAIQLVGVACNGLEALTKIAELKPQVVTLDVEMPEMTGLEALREIAKRHANVRVVMLSSLTTQGADTTIEALMSGASDYVGKPAQMEGSAFERLSVELLMKVKQFFRFAGSPSDEAAPAPKPIVLAASPAATIYHEICAIGVSTGGPTALLEALPMAPRDFPLPIVIVQHMPPLFTQMLAERLDRACAIEVREGKDGMTVEAGQAIVAPGGYHMRVVRAGRGLAVALDEGPRENSCRPAVDVLFRSIVENLDGRAIAAVLTGMGYDGLEGSRMLKARGATVLAQDEATSVVWGMPGAVVGAHLADAVLPIHRIVPELMKRAHTR
ncbi:response regulator receiver modulated CheB methylesterase [Granulicella rosea]|uniref:Protein-glutamate methylesterase/protein-glutamine glutaminase n=1 Tax=Granulicella rosea TaxID=474952 RepID=A0A239CW40_9BACT|nr:chemotaxis response regulator protein-glutamate methylesterase [Granulicella rosea]SNS23998.1 response regulator receiver modulated CheB methylesterase [Granulicella rosea]